VIRTPVERIPVYGRSSQGVYVMHLKEGDKVASISSANGNGNPDTADSSESDGAVPEAAEPEVTPVGGAD